ncbi:uncharacterized protein LOC135488657 [Lineus longissimus]|uniref:uncharacterized protein LOC135488657 n=1 Tax=Lineus longissimus TaxID=88925 RepID=UPI00315D1E66
MIWACCYKTPHLCFATHYQILPLNRIYQRQSKHLQRQLRQFPGSRPTNPTKPSHTPAMDRAQFISLFLLVLITGEMVNALKVAWPAYPGKQGIRSSVCQKRLNCGPKNIATKGVCKLFCLGRKRFWEKCGKNGSKNPKAKICKAIVAKATEKAGSGLIKLTDAAVKGVLALASLTVFGKRDQMMLEKSVLE